MNRTGRASSAAPTRPNSEYAAFVGSFLLIFRNSIRTVVDDDETAIAMEKRKLVLHLRSRADTKMELLAE